MAIIWSNGTWMNENEGFVSMEDRGVLHGLGAFETMLAIDGSLQYAERHLRRLQQSVELLGLRHSISVDELKQLAQEICEKNHLSEGRARLRFTATAGEGALHDVMPGSTASLWLTASALPDMPTEISVVTLPFTRNEKSALKGLKSCSYAENLVALRWARERGAGEGIFFNNRGELCEACTANVFVKIDGQWHTPTLDSGCLPGVMRQMVLENDPSIRESHISREDFARAESMFLTSAIRGIVFVSSCDGKYF